MNKKNRKNAKVLRCEEFASLSAQYTFCGAPAVSKLSGKPVCQEHFLCAQYNEDGPCSEGAVAHTLDGPVCARHLTEYSACEDCGLLAHDGDLRDGCICPACADKAK